EPGQRVRRGGVRARPGAVGGAGPYRAAHLHLSARADRGGRRSGRSRGERGAALRAGAHRDRGTGGLGARRARRRRRRVAARAGAPGLDVLAGQVGGPARAADRGVRAGRRAVVRVLRADRDHRGVLRGVVADPVEHHRGHAHQGPADRDRSRAAVVPGGRVVEDPSAGGHREHRRRTPARVVHLPGAHAGRRDGRQPGRAGLPAGQQGAGAAARAHVRRCRRDRRDRHRAERDRARPGPTSVPRTAHVGGRSVMVTGTLRTPRKPGRTAKLTSPGIGTPARGLLPLVLLLVLWELTGDPQSPYFPPPGSWLAGVEPLVDNGKLLPSLGETAITFVLGLAIATVLGALVGTLVGARRPVDCALSPSLEFLRALP